MEKQMINEKQCFALCTLTEYVAHYASHWWNNWFSEELKSSSAARVGMELLKCLRKGLQLLQICAAKHSIVVWTIVRGAGPFREVIEDVRRYAQIMNRLFGNSFLDLEKSEIVEQLKHKVEFDCRVLHTSLGYAYRLDRITILEGFKSSSNNGLVLHDTLRSCLISILDKRLLSDIDKSNLTEKELLGHGSYGCVMKAKLYGLPVAVKEFSGKEYFEDELNIFKKFLETDYPSHVVGILGCSGSSIILELMGKNLTQLIQEEGGHPLPFSESIGIMLQIAEGMRCLHGHDVIHRDLKPANVLTQVREGQGLVVIADFGISKKHFKTELTNTSYRGTRLYMAPEMMKEGRKYTRKVDVHSFAMICSEILTGKQTDLKPKQLKNGKRPPLPENIPISLGRLIKRCWDQMDKNRPKFEEICDELWLIKEKCLTGCIEEDVEAALDDKTKLSFSIAGLRCLSVENDPNHNVDRYPRGRGFRFPAWTGWRYPEWYTDFLCAGAAQNMYGSYGSISFASPTRPASYRSSWLHGSSFPVEPYEPYRPEPLVTPNRYGNQYGT